jgi:hypothetical protein
MIGSYETALSKVWQGFGEVENEQNSILGRINDEFKVNFQ